MSSRRITYDELKSRLQRLDTSLLPSDKLAGDYTDQEEDRVRAYVLLAHAEFEQYFETLALFTAHRAKARSGPASCEPVVSRLILYRAIRSDEKIEMATNESISGAVSFFEKTVNRNHGLKSSNILRIFMPLGLNHRDVDPVLLADLDAFGTLRGGIAHTTAKLVQGSSPSQERKRVANLLSGISQFDEKVRSSLLS